MPKIVDKETKKMEILRAAMPVFARKGFANTKMIDIAEAAGIGKGTVYEYFKNKNDIFEFSFHHFMESIEIIIAREVFKVTDPVEKIKSLAYAWAKVISDHTDDILEIMLDFWAEAIRNKNESKLKLLDFQKIYGEYRALLMSILDEGIHQGKFRPVNTFYIASLIVGMLDGVMLQVILDRDNFDVNEAMSSFAEELLAGIIIT